MAKDLFAQVIHMLPRVELDRLASKYTTLTLGKMLKRELVEEELIRRDGPHLRNELLVWVTEGIMKSLSVTETYCPFCKKKHVGGDTCLGHHP